MKYLFFLFTFFLFNVNNDCEIDFNSVGLNNYNLNMSFSKLKCLIPELKKEPNNKLDDDLHVYSFDTNQRILNVDKKVKYFFAFKENKLQAYVFNVYSGKNINYYKSFVKEARKSNAFISEKGTSFLETKSNCEKFLRIKSDPNEIIIFGGVSRIGGYW